MKVLKNHISALQYSFQLFFQGKFLKFLIPGIVLTVLFYFISVILSFTGKTFSILGYIPWIGSYLDSAVDSVFGWVYGVAMFIYQFTILTLFSPINTALSTKLDEHETEQKFGTPFKKVVKDFIRLLGILFVGGLIYLFLFILWSQLAKLVGLTFLSPVVSFILIAFFTGYNSYDYSLERYDIGVRDSWKFAFKYPLYMIITGSIFSLFLMIPIVGIIFAPIVLTMVGTLNYLKIKEETG